MVKVALRSRADAGSCSCCSTPSPAAVLRVEGDGVVFRLCPGCAQLLMHELKRHVKSPTEAEDVTCSLCGRPCKAAAAHLHQGEWVGDECCWDERLRASE